MVITHFLVLNNLRLGSTLFHLDVNLDSGDRTGWNRKQQELQRIMTLINSELEKTDGNVLKCDAVESHSELSLSEVFNSEGASKDVCLQLKTISTSCCLSLSDLY